MIETSTDHKDKLVSDLQVVIADIEELLLVTANHVGESAMELRKRVQARLQQTKTELAHLQEAALSKAKAGSQAIDEFVHENPWQAVGIAAGIGVLMGLMMGRR